MKNIYSCMSQLNDIQNDNVHNELQVILKDFTKCLTAAICFANKQAKVSDANFWAGLFERDANRDSILAFGADKDGLPHQVPTNPYKKLDLQACLKYLYYGGNRPTYQDQKNFLNLFIGQENRDYYYKRVTKDNKTISQLHAGNFSWLLYQGISVRNTIAGHPDEDTVCELTFADRSVPHSVPHILRVITGLMEPLCSVSWDAAEQQKCTEFVNGLWLRIYLALGEAPYSIPGIMKAMDFPESDRLSVEHALIESGLQVQGDQVYVCGDIGDVAYALYFSRNAVHNRMTEMFKSLYNSVRLKARTSSEPEPDWDSLNVEELKVLSDKGNAEAQYRLACCYLSGEGIDADEAKAYHYFHEAANQDHPHAQVQLGKFCELGKGGQSNPFRDVLFPEECLIDLEEAATWYMKAANQNDTEGYLNLGRCYEQGIGLPRDLVKARRCYSRAANENCNEAKVAAAMLYLRSLGCQNTDKSVAQGMLRELAETVPAAKTALGICYQHGHGITPDIVEAVRLYREAADMGDAQAKYQLAKCYAQGTGVEMDMSAYFTLLQEAADMGCPEAAIESRFDPPTWQADDQGSALAQCLLAECLPEEWSGEEILCLYSTAAKTGYQPAVYGMAKCHERGIGTQPDYDRAVYLYKRAANAGEVDAMVRLAAHYHDVACGKAQDDEYLYEGGDGFAMAQAHCWYQFAARCGHPTAQKWMVENATPKQAQIWRAYAAKCGNSSL